MQKSLVLKALLLILFLLPVVIVRGQVDTSGNKTDTLPERFYVLQNVSRYGETLPEIEIKEVTITGRSSIVSRFQFWRYERMIYNVKRVYPYAILVRDKLDEVNSVLERIPDDKSRKDYLREFEKEIFRDYEDDMRQMTFTQGKILIKLIDRETENTSYDLIKDYRGTLSAFFWQGIARLFGSNLKQEYDPFGEDILIERIIYEIEQGRL